MNKSESKYFSTSRLMDDALVSLLKEKDFDYITVKEICERAGVNRSTFYLHYESISDLLNEALAVCHARFLSMFPESPEHFIPEIEKAALKELVLINEDYLRPYLCFIRDNKSIFLAAYRNPVCMNTAGNLEALSHHILFPILQRFGIPAGDRDYWVNFSIHGCMGIVTTWLSKNCTDSVDDVVRIMIDCIRPAIEPKTAERREEDHEYPL